MNERISERPSRARLQRYLDTCAVNGIEADDEMLLPCQWCGSVELTISGDNYPLEPWHVVCDCYDGAEDSPGRHDFGRGATLLDAIDDWNERCESAAERARDNAAQTERDRYESENRGLGCTLASCGMCGACCP